ncbi:MAG TPA: TIGR01777 family oxidoreductase, partial [Acidobacteriota bacterium]|nr:TIGR01777 family oxidoreductase [Acidobacteriota bacterium]
MKIVLAGGSGQVGRVLARAFQGQRHEVVILSRSPEKGPVPMVQWDGKSLDGWVRELDGADVVVNLAGRSVNCRYHGRNRRLILESRVHSTRAVGEAIATCRVPPRVWLQMSTATIYAHRYDRPNDEETGLIKGSLPEAPDKWKFSVEVAKAWEREVDRAKTPETRTVTLRSAMVMSPDRGGIFGTLLGLVRWGLGGKAGHGRQYVSWIHEQDFVNAVLWLIDHDEIQGAVNLASPNPLPYADFMRILRQAWGVRFGLPASKWMIEIGAILMRTESELVLKSRRVIPGRLLDQGFHFNFPTWERASQDLC